MRALRERLTDRKLLSRGDISAAYRAHDVRLDRDVFLKILHPHLAGDPDLLARFEREARAAARLNHPQLVKIYEVGEDPSEGPYMVHEWVDGESLRSRLEREQKLSPSEVRRLAEALCSGLSALHSSGILHRDIKPENILCSSSGEFKLTDFSLALLADVPKLTYHTAIVGTPAYLAPEVARGKGPSELSDLFAVGVVLFEAATGANPFDAGALLESLRRVREEEPDWSRLDAAELDESLGKLIKSCLAKEADDRPVSAQDARNLLNGNAHSAKLARRSHSRIIPLALFLALVLGVLSYALWPTRKVAESNNTHLTQQDSLGHEQDSAAFQGNIASMDSSARRAESLPRDTTSTLAGTTTPISPISDSRRTLEDSDSQTFPPPPKQDTPARLTDPSDRTSQTRVNASAATDSFDLFLDSTPWARVSLEGVEFGITPLGAPVRLPEGRHVVLLRNPAYPPIQVSVELRQDTRTTVSLDRYVQHLDVSVEPWGDVYIDGERIGTTPLNRMPVVLPGDHSLRITHPSLPAIESDWQAAAGETLSIRANLQTSELAVRQSGGGN